MILLMFITALSLSAIAAYYSLMGLAAIFAAAVVPIIIMGGVLEVAKLVVASWVYRNWKEAPLFLKSYLSFAIVILMIITSMGIFGFLSKAHLDQALPTGDIAEKITFIDEQINIERENIANAKSLIKQMDDVVIKKMDSEGRDLKDKNNNTYKEDVAERALSIRRSQSKDRAKLSKQIDESQNKIVELQKQKAPISKDLRQMEAEVGPVKYIAALIYGDNLDQSLLEKAVRGVIIMIVSVFDPLAVLMLIAANWSLKHKQPLAPSPVVKDLGPIQRKVIKGPVKKPQAEAPKEPVKVPSAKKPRVLRKPINRKWLEKVEDDIIPTAPPPPPPLEPRKPTLEIFSDGQHTYKDKDNSL